MQTPLRKPGTNRASTMDWRPSRTCFKRNTSLRRRIRIEAARGALSDAQVAFVESLGILPPPTPSRRRFGKIIFENSADSLDDLLDRALSQRPTSSPAGNLRARQAGVKKARATYYPKISLGATPGGGTGRERQGLAIIWR